ncbi:glycosyltransferase family 2 protein [Chitinivorax sp. B]|uniref:glycosyltransferase family 2 protein n=1 Tax=Chitinivorax sp. B TaxID=2502235 RepID=UPI0010F51657|nr:glycosyltransferase family 2 protein [Chitinivorax sp. B]
MPNKLSAILITKNAAHQLPACLSSLQFTDEIIVVDSGSTDNTVEIAIQHGAKVIHQTWLGFGKQKQLAVNHSSHDWVLCIDSDERITPTLRDSIQAILRSPLHMAYRMPRSNCFMGRFLKHGEGYPDWNIRLFNRQFAQWSDDVVHERVMHTGRVGTLAGDLLHESSEDITHYFDKQNRYTTLQAQTLFEHGKKSGVTQLLLSPIFRFVRFYLFKRGFLDGVPGLVHILIGCFNSFSKYAKLIELHRLHKRP